MFASCYGPVVCSPCTGKDFYDRAFVPAGRPTETSAMTTRVISQSLGPDFHRQDTQPYGLRHRDRREMES